MPIESIYFWYFFWYLYLTFRNANLDIRLLFTFRTLFCTLLIYAGIMDILGIENFFANWKWAADDLLFDQTSVHIYITYRHIPYSNLYSNQWHCAIEQLFFVYKTERKMRRKKKSRTTQSFAMRHDSWWWHSSLDHRENSYEIIIINGSGRNWYDLQLALLTAYYCHVRNVNISMDGRMCNGPSVATAGRSQCKAHSESII